MKVHKLFIYLLIASAFLMIIACGGGGGGDSTGSGEVTMSITDAKPVLPEGAEYLLITFEEVLVHKAGGGWISLPLAESPYTIDLLQFYNGKTTELVPPVSLESGKYTKIRIVVSEATIGIKDEFDEVNDFKVTIPSENLKTDKNFIFDVKGGGAVDITVDFDLSKSLVVTDELGTPSYKLKPVLHIVKTLEAATIIGWINDTSFIDPYDARVTVFVYNTDIGDYEEYTKLDVSPDEISPTEFSIYWLVPNEKYLVEIDFNTSSDLDVKYTEEIDPTDDNVDIGPGAIHELNGGNPI